MSTKNQNTVNVIINQFINGEKKSAIDKLQQYIKNNDDDLNAKYNFGYMHQQIKNYDEAIKWYLEVIKKNKLDWKSKKNLSEIYLKINALSEALNYINLVIDIKPNSQSALSDKSLILLRLNKLDEALEVITKSININKDDFVSQNNAGLIYMHMQKNELAEKKFLKSIELNSNYIPAYSNLGRCYDNMNLQHKSYIFYKKAFTLNPNSFIILNNLAGHYLDNGNYEKSLKYYLKASKINPLDLTVLSNISKSYFLLDQYNLSIEYIKRCLKKDPTNDEYTKTYSLILFKLQEYEQAWSLNEGRLKLSEFNYINQNNKINKFLFKNKEIDKNDKILIIREQGIGDELLYATIYPNLIKNYKNVSIETDPKLISLFQNNLEKNRKIFYPFGTFSRKEEDLKKFNVVLYAGSLGNFFRKNISDFPKKKLLNCDKNTYESIKKKLSGIDDNIKIGISWKSFRKKKSIGKLKSIDLKYFSPLFKLKNITFINLQYGDVKNEIDEFNSHNNVKIHTINTVDIYNDMNSLAALLKNLDLFISNSNTTVHLAGTLGVETYLIKPMNHASFHYWNQPSKNTPWYSSIRLYDGSKNCEDAILCIKNDLVKKFNIRN